jgi:ribosomal protein S18 acetylase RimI-like enzyme
MDEPAVQIATPADAPSISDLLYEFNGEALPPAELAERMEQAQGLETVFLGELAGRLAGLLVLRTVPTLSEPEDWAEITELYVRPAARRRGVGKALVEAVIQYAQSRGCTQVHLLFDPENRAALSFYTAVGFHRDSWEMRRRI